MVKRLLAIGCIILTAGISTLQVGSPTETFMGPPEPTKRLVEGNYEDCGLLFTDDGHIWECHKYDIPDSFRVVACFDTKRTEDVEDDDILNIVELDYQDGSLWFNK